MSNVRHRKAIMDAFEQLRVDYLAGEVSLFVGAGVSMGCGLPDWRGLAEGVVRLFPRKPRAPLGTASAATREGKQPPADPNALSALKANVLAREEPLLSMRYARSDGELDLNSLVCRCLYAMPIPLSESVLAIPTLEKARRICCFNYDDILDRSFAARGTACLALFQDMRIPLESPQTIIFYPHGFLPDPSRHSFPPTEKIVLSEDDYHDLYRSPYAWANMVQLTLLLNYTALFIGCSLLDPNVRRLLDISAKVRPAHSHYAFVRDPYFRKDAKWYKQNYGIAFRSVQERILRGLGIRPVWIQEYSEIASALSSLRA
jgi:hypothetical protein